MVFVFGSNLAGRHGKGAALFARKNHGAVYGQGRGYQGNSYGIPTKGKQLEKLSLFVIQHHVSDFISFAWEHPELIFQVTRIGCGLAGNKESEIMPMFDTAPDNCYFNWSEKVYTEDDLRKAYVYAHCEERSADGWSLSELESIHERFDDYMKEINK